MSFCKVGNQTSSQDPQAVNSRIFVGNLNTFQVNKIDVEKVFQRYGRIVGISMHKGYAFVQFASPFDARSACLGEDGRTISGQVIDVNMVSEPKPHLGKLKGQTRKTDSGNESPLLTEDGDTVVDASGIPRKRPRLAQEPEPQPKVTASDLATLKTYDIPDILICGNCKDMFSNLNDIIEHKKNYCKLRFACKCGPRDATPQAKACTTEGGGSSVALLCSSCQAGFADPMDLLVHVQEVHSVDIFAADDPELSHKNEL